MDFKLCGVERVGNISIFFFLSFPLNFVSDHCRISSDPSPLYIQTNFAWYILKTPAKEYRSLFYAFYRPHRVAQIVISTALDNPQYTYQAFRDLYVGIYDEFLSRTLEEEMIESYVRESIPILCVCLIPSPTETYHSHGSRDRRRR